MLHLRAAGFAVALVGLCAVGCEKPQPASTVFNATPLTVADAGSGTTDAAASASPGSRMPFALVAIDEIRQLYKLLDGHVLGAEGGVLYALGRDGSVRSLDNVFFAVRSALGDLGVVGGSWPGTLYLETFRLGTGNGETRSFAVRGDDRRAVVERRLLGTYWLAPARWKDGALLTLQAVGHSAAFGDALDRTARFEVLGSAKLSPPRLPKEALFDNDFVAYPSGTVFMLGQRRTRPVNSDDASEYEEEHHYMLDGAMVWQLDAGATTLHAVQLPDTGPRDRLRGARLALGQEESATLVYGVLERWKDRQSTDEPYLARFGRAGWRRIPIDTRVLRVDSAADGSTWALRGSDGYDEKDESFLEKVHLLADGAVRFERVPLAPSPTWLSLGQDAVLFLKGCTRLRPRELAAADKEDIWLSAQCIISGSDFSPTVLLHTQAQRPLVVLKTFERAAPPAPGK